MRMFDIIDNYGKYIIKSYEKNWFTDLFPSFRNNKEYRIYMPANVPPTEEDMMEWLIKLVELTHPKKQNPTTKNTTVLKTVSLLDILQKRKRD